MSSASQQSSATTWDEPPWTSWIETTQDALLILEAARRGLIPRVRRRLVDSERKLITSGSVFVFDEDESGIKRWTDGFFWSPSRILGNFLLYRETGKRGPGPKGTGPDDSADANASQSPENHSLSRPKTESTKQLGVDKLHERSLVTNSDKFKSGGLMKKTFSLSIGGVAQHLISYYRIEDVENGRLRSPSSLPELASLDISPEYLDKTHFRNPPKVEVGQDGVLRYGGEADEVEEKRGCPKLRSAI
ncbi:Gti1/Pac2 family-domain-containing protein [Rhodocollybia butyracea]|uniref:Gti1/Pac2 family-domain-containing protein n=1 Tax=Rhodocollybia butyracea TaxID=206335 RepID=A0A9P5Q4U2_9AGAR|nr:Gti1/Pac2 family-domain-containing protein [Rhodocollybia butyracea]